MKQVTRTFLLGGLLAIGCLRAGAGAQDHERRDREKEPLPAKRRIIVRDIDIDDVREDLMPSGAEIKKRVLGRMGLQHRLHASPEDHADFEAMRRAVDVLKSAKTDEDKAKASKELASLLAKAFDRDLERREREVSDVEARVKKLREQIEKRKKAKEQIIDLRLKTITNEAEGLGFPSLFGPDRPFPPEFHFGPREEPFVPRTGPFGPRDKSSPPRPPKPPASEHDPA